MMESRHSPVANPVSHIFIFVFSVIAFVIVFVFVSVNQTKHNIGRCYPTSSPSCQCDLQCRSPTSSYLPTFNAVGLTLLTFEDFGKLIHLGESYCHN